MLSCQGVGRRFKGKPWKISHRERKRSGSFNGYHKKCDLSGILLLEDNNNEHDAAKLPGD